LAIRDFSRRVEKLEVHSNPSHRIDVGGGDELRQRIEAAFAKREQQAAVQDLRLGHQGAVRTDSPTEPEVWAPADKFVSAPSRTARAALDFERKYPLADYGGEGSEQRLQLEPEQT
jgi:hypothetical protein